MSNIFPDQLKGFYTTATVDPTSSNDATDGRVVGSMWVNISSSPRKIFICTNNSSGAAVWERIDQNNITPSNIQIKGFQQGEIYAVTTISRTNLRLASNSVHDVNGQLIQNSSNLDIDFSGITNIYRTDGTTPIVANTETQNKHMYLLLNDSGQLSGMIVPDTDLPSASHAYGVNPKLIIDYYSITPSIWDFTKNGYYKNGKRIIATLRLDSSNIIEFWYQLGFGSRFRDVQHLAIGNKYIETRWKREHPACYAPDGSTITNMSTEAPVLFEILNGNVLPDWRDRFPRNIDIAGGRSIRDTQDDAFQGFKMKSSSAPSWVRSGSTGIPTTGGTVGSVLLEMDSFISNGYGVPRVDNETRGKNYAESNQIVKG